MQFWKGQRVLFNGMLGTVYQDQGLDKTVKVTLDDVKNVVESAKPHHLYLIQSPAEEDHIDQFIKRQYLP